MTAPRELDYAVAKAVMGWKITPDGYGSPERNKKGTLAGIALQIVPLYSTYMSAAFDVVERMRAQGWFVSIDDGAKPSTAWVCTFSQGPKLVFSEAATTLPEAICLAALAAYRRGAGR